MRSKHQLSSNASILARSASIRGEAAGGVPGDSSGERDDEDSRSASGVLTAAAAELDSGNNQQKINGIFSNEDAIMYIPGFSFEPVTHKACHGCC